MKKLLLFVSVLTLGFTSCNKDDDSSTSAALEGKWEYFQNGVGANGQEVLVDYTHTAGCEKDFVMITATTFVDHEFSSNNDTPQTCSEDTFSTPYTRSGNTITVTEGGETTTSEIVQLDGSILKIKTNFEGQSGDFITVYKRVN